MLRQITMFCYASLLLPRLPQVDPGKLLNPCYPLSYAHCTIKAVTEKFKNTLLIFIKAYTYVNLIDEET